MTVSFLQSFGQESPTVALSPTASSAVCQPKPQTDVGTPLTDESREDAIRLAASLVIRYMDEYRRSGNFADLGSAERARTAMDKLIAGRSPRAEGEAAMQRCTDTAVALGFSTEAARAFVLNWLAEYGPTPGEDMVEAASQSGRDDLLCHDARCWGSVFSVLARRNRIRCVRSDLPRKHGHGTSGGRLWALNEGN